jgi:glycosidase
MIGDDLKKYKYEGDNIMSKEKILHLFQWNISDIIDNLEEIKANGWTSILTTPVQPSKEESSLAWYMRYQITSLSIGNKYGSKILLKELCEKAHKLGLKVYTDIIITHFGNKSKEEELIPHENVDINLVDNKYFWREKKYIDYNSRYSICHHCNALPAIKTENFDYQNLVIKFIDQLIDCGVDGVRVDSAKMIATPEEDFGESRNMFFERVLKEIKKSIYVFGEVIFEKKEMIEKYQKHIDVLTEFNKNSYSLNKQNCILFIESHDTFLDEGIGYTSKWSMDKIINDYEFLAKDFQKVLFYSRPFDNSWCSDRVKNINLKYN